MLRTKTLQAALLLPAALAVSYIANVGTAKADSALDAQLAEYAADEAVSGAGKATTTQNAQPNDLVYAVYTTVFENNFANDRVAQIAADALAVVNGKIRGDRDKVAGRIVAAAIFGAHGEDDPVLIKAVLDKVLPVNNGAKGSLTANGRAAAIAAAIKSSTRSVNLLPSDFTNPALNSGAAIAASANAAVVGNPLAFQKAVVKALGSGTGANNLAPYFNGVLNAIPGDKSANAIALASSANKSPVIAGGAIAGRASQIAGFAPLVGTDGDVTALAQAAAKTGALKGVINGVVSGAFRFLSPAKLRGDAAATLAADPKLKASAGLIASGALQARDDLAGETTDSVIQKVLGASALPTNKYGTFGGQAALGNAPAADEIINSMVARITASSKDVQNITALASAVLKSIVANDPSDIQDAAAAASNASRNGANVFNDSTRVTLAANLAKAAAKNYTAAGAAVAGVLSTTASLITTAPATSAAAIKANAKAATGIAQQVSALIVANGGTATNLQNYAVSVAAAVATGSGGAVIAGVAITDPTNTGALVTATINGNSKLRAQTLKIAQTVATNVDIERIGDVAKAVGTLIQPKSGGQPGLPKITSIGSLATALTKAINAKPLSSPVDPLRPDAGWHNRVDEIGELAAVLVNSSLAISGGSDPKVLASIGTAIFKGVSNKLLANAGNFQADLKDVANDVAGAIFQAISVASSSLLPTDQRDALLSATGILATTLVKSAGKFGADVSSALAAVNGATGNPGRIVTGTEPIGNGTPTATGKYEIGNIVDPETPAKNI